MAEYAGALDQGTTSTRFMIFDHSGQVVSVDQKEHEQIYPKPGWVEHDANEIWTRCQEVIKGALDKKNLKARRPSSGSARPESPSTTRLSGRTLAPTSS
jgi:glycerol kinase